MNKPYHYVAIIYLSLVLIPFSNAKLSKIQLNEIINSNGINSSDLSIQINKDSKPVIELNNEVLKIPASITKILTSYAVLKNIPLNYKFKTELFYDQKNLYLKGSGDPGFVSESMWNLVNDFKRQNITSIPGDIVIDDSLFDAVRYDESRESVRVDRSYDAPVSAMSFNWNSVNIYVKPELNKVQVILDPESNYFSVKNTAKVNSGKKVKDLIISVDQKNKVIHVSGEVSAKSEEKVYFKNVADPIHWVGENLKSFLKQRGISVQGKIRSGKLTPSAIGVAAVESKTLSAMIADMNKFSNNFVAEMLTKKMSSLVYNTQANLSNGVLIIKKELDLIGIKKYTLVNPSGLSRENLNTAKQFVDILDKIKNDFRIFPTFIESLPIAGLDGTLKKRMKESKAEGYVRAKTGYLDGVVTLAGYASDSDSSQNEMYSFSFMYNGQKDEAIVRKAFDQILIQLLND